MENNLFNQDRAGSPASKLNFDCVTPSRTVYLDYHSPNIIYASACSKFSL